VRDVQTVCNVDSLDGEFAIVCTDRYGAKCTTKAVDGHASAEAVEAALNSLPDLTLDVGVITKTPTSTCSEGWEITFEGDQNHGQQTTLRVLARECQGGCQPRIAGLGNLVSASTDVEVGLQITVNYGIGSNTLPATGFSHAEGHFSECGRRGKCDYATGVCECFSGFTGESCGTQSVLA
jgi:hypothetical protein